MRLNRNKLEGKVWGGFADAHPQTPAGGFADAYPCPFGAGSLTRTRNPLRGANWAKQLTSRLRQDEFYLQSAPNASKLALWPTTNKTTTLTGGHLLCVSWRVRTADLLRVKQAL